MTAVEWLVANLFVYGMPDQRCIELVKKAKEMEKQQIIDAYDKCYQDLFNTQKEVDKLATYVSELPQTEITDEEIAEKAEEFELTNGIYGFKHGVKWYRERLKQTHAPHLEG